MTVTVIPGRLRNEAENLALYERRPANKINRAHPGTQNEKWIFSESLSVISRRCRAIFCIDNKGGQPELYPRTRVHPAQRPPLQKS